MTRVQQTTHETWKLLGARFQHHISTYPSVYKPRPHLLPPSVRTKTEGEEDGKGVTRIACCGLRSHASVSLPASHNTINEVSSRSIMSSCSGGDSFRITGFQLGAFDGCYSASSVSTFNFLPIFYNTADGVPADGPAVYASDLFGTLSNEVRCI